MRPRRSDGGLNATHRSPCQRLFTRESTQLFVQLAQPALEARELLAHGLEVTPRRVVERAQQLFLPPVQRLFAALDGAERRGERLGSTLIGHPRVQETPRHT